MKAPTDQLPVRSQRASAAPAAWRSSPPCAAPRRASADLVAERCDAAVRNRGRSGSARLALETTLMTRFGHAGWPGSHNVLAIGGKLGLLPVRKLG
jgi:hypothetical protein